MTQVTDATLNDGGGWSKLLWASDLWSARYGVQGPEQGRQLERQRLQQLRQDDRRGEEARRPAVHLVVRRPAKDLPAVVNGYLCEVMEVSLMPKRSAFRRYRLGYDTQGNIVPEELGQSQNLIEASRNTLA